MTWPRAYRMARVGIELPRRLDVRFEQTRLAHDGGRSRDLRPRLDWPADSMLPELGATEALVLVDALCQPQEDEQAPVKSLEEIRPGLRLGRYECLLPIARGGMAAVWAAKVTGARGFEKVVAIKTMLPSLSDDPNFERMFLDEARIASRIRHPNVAEILDLGEQDNLLYLVMEWIDGAPLSLIMRESFRRGGMPTNIGVRIIQDVCAALHAAHELRGEDGKSLELVHRDVSPQNIMLTENGVVKLVDFGVAKALGRSAGETDTGMIRGKLAYLSPEQVIAQPLDRRTDLFALGVILYQITTGKHPFRADNAGATMNNILRRKVPKPSKIVGPSYPAKLDEVVMRALDREQEFRFQTAADMLKSLDEVFLGRDRATSEDVAAYIQPIIGSAGEAFRSALQQASRVPSTSGEDVADLLAKGAEPVESTPASGQWIMGSSSMAGIARQPSSPPPASEPLPAPPAPPSFPADEARSPARGQSADGDALLSAPSETARSTDGAGASSMVESTMSGAQRDTVAPSLRSSRRRKIGAAVLGGALMVSVGIIVTAHFLSPVSTSKELAAQRDASLVASAGSLPAASIPAAPTPTSEGATTVGAIVDGSVEAWGEEGGAGDEEAGDGAAPNSPGEEAGGGGGEAPSKNGAVSTATARPRSTKPSKSAKPTKPTKKWTPPVSDPGF